MEAGRTLDKLAIAKAHCSDVYAGCNYVLEERLEVWTGMAGRRRSPKLTEKAERTLRLGRPKSAQGAQGRREGAGT